MHVTLWHRGRPFKLRIKPGNRDRLDVRLDEKPYDVRVESMGNGEFVLMVDGRVFDVIVADNGVGYSVYINGKCIPIEKKSALDLLSGVKQGSGRRDIKTAMPGRIIKVLSEPGAEVEEGQAVLILEAMKMQNEIKSPQPGRIVRITAQAGDSVEAGALLFTVE